MCGRFSQAYTYEEVFAFSQPLTVEGGSQLIRPRYNIAPTTEVDIIVKVDGERVLKKARWGFIPAWWKKAPNEVGSTFNARIEKVADSAMFRSAYVKRRCIVPASGFYEWTGEKGNKIPHFFSAADGELLGFAGLYETWINPETKQPVVSCTIITRDANKWMSAYHDRMPAILLPRDFDAWLDGTGDRELLMQPPRALREWIVSNRMNKTGVGDNDPTLVDPVEPAMFPEVKPPPRGDLF